MLATIIRNIPGLQTVLSNPTKVSLKIDINFTRLTSEEKAEFFRLIQTAYWLKELNFSGCCLNDIGMNMLVNSLSSHRLTSLNLSGNQLNDTGALLALKLPVESLNLSHNQLTDEAFNRFHDDPPEEAMLRELLLDNNQQLTVDALPQLNRMGLTSLSMKGCRFTVEALDSLLQNTTLIHFTYDRHQPTLNPTPVTNFYQRVKQLQQDNVGITGPRRRIASAYSLSEEAKPINIKTL